MGRGEESREERLKEGDCATHFTRRTQPYLCSAAAQVGIVGMVKIGTRHDSSLPAYIKATTNIQPVLDTPWNPYVSRIYP